MADAPPARHLRADAVALAGVAEIRRPDTRGGAAPKAECDAGHAQARLRYSAIYQFFGAGK